MEDAGFSLEDNEDDDEILEDLDDSDSDDMFSFDLSMDDDDI